MMSGENLTRAQAQLMAWKTRYRLTYVETELLRLTALDGVARGALHVIRGTEEATVKKQVQVLLTKTGDSSLIAAALRLVREACF